MINTDISLVIPYYNHPNFLKIQLERWNNYSDKIKENVEIVLIDDGSEISILDLPDLPKFPENLTIYRITEDIFWNVKGARNLGAYVSNSKWVLFHDFDHWFDTENLEKILDMKKNHMGIYRFSRKRDGKIVNFHEETHLIRKNGFLNDIGGHDEDFVGLYGGGMRLYYRIAESKGFKVILLNNIFVETDGVDKVEDADTTYYLKEKKAKEKETELRRKKWKGEIPISKDILRFNWVKLL